MKKIILLALTVLVMVGCVYETGEQKSKYDSTKEKWHGFHVEVIDSCEYILRYTERGSGHKGFGQSFMAHKGNCRFCKERRQKELEELVIKLKK